MQLTVIGGTGLIGSQVVQKLTAAGHQAVPAPAAPLQPMASADVADAVAGTAAGPPLRAIRNVAGPDVFPLDEIGRLTLAAQQDNRTVITDNQAGTFGGVTGDVLTAGPDAHLAATHYQAWMSSTTS
jgi:uncharacterized protein YbjT (DUF2867 family)